MSEFPSPRTARTPYRRVSENRRILRATVVDAHPASSSMRCVTIGGPDLAHFRYFGDDHAFRLFFARPSHSELRLPPSEARGWMVPYLRMPSAGRPYVRFYTARSFRRNELEIDIEFVVHGSDAPGSGWALRARPGDGVGIFDEGAMYTPPLTGVGWQLLIGDESALPAILATLEQHPDLESHAVVEVPTRDDVREVELPGGPSIRWLPRENPRELVATSFARRHFPRRL
jgi:NADPH-dependent ferric siderophore reductase